MVKVLREIKLKLKELNDSEVVFEVGGSASNEQMSTEIRIPSNDVKAIVRKFETPHIH